MTIRRQDISVLLLYYIGYSAIRNLILRLQRKPVARFVAFHDIKPGTLGRFKANLKFLKQSANVVSLDDFFIGRLSLEKINVVITFDDGYKSWVSEAVPVLKELGLPATFFVSSGFVGLSKEDEAAFIRKRLFLTMAPRKITGGLSREDVIKIVKNGFTIGGHTLNHTNLAEFRDSVSLRYEIAEDKMRLERIIDRKVDYFSYPVGAYNNPEINIAKVLQESGYRGAVTAVSGFNSLESNPYLLHRELTDSSMPGQVFRARVNGNYDAIQFLKEVLKAKSL